MIKTFKKIDTTVEKQQTSAKQYKFHGATNMKALTLTNIILTITNITVENSKHKLYRNRESPRVLENPKIPTRHMEVRRVIEESLLPILHGLHASCMKIS